MYDFSVAVNRAIHNTNTREKKGGGKLTALATQCIMDSAGIAEMEVA